MLRNKMIRSHWMKKYTSVAAAALLCVACTGNICGDGGAGKGNCLDKAGNRVFFEFDRPKPGRIDLDVDSKEIVKKIAEWARANPNCKLIVEGYADPRGTKEYNLALGERRATAVKNDLVAQGVAADRIEIVSFGKDSDPVADAERQGLSEEDYFARRRVAITAVKC